MYNYNKSILENFMHPEWSDVEAHYSDDLFVGKEMKNFIIKDCITLKNYLMHFMSNDSCYKNNCCKYINYWLNKTERMTYKSGGANFKIYEAYMNKYITHNTDNLCISNIKYMHPSVFENVKTLYQMYDFYNKFISKRNESISCTYAQMCFKAYDDIVTNFHKEGYSKFCSVLKDFKKIFEEDEWVSRRKCDHKIPHLLSYPDACTHSQEISEEGIVTVNHQTVELKPQETFGEASHPQSQQEIKRSEEDTVLLISFGATLPITLISSGIGVLLMLLSSYKVNNDSI